MKQGMAHIIAKTNPLDTTQWLPLFYHLQDTAGVMKILTEEWLPEATIRATGLIPSEFRRIALFCALAHDIGKATPAFQRKVIGGYPEIEAVLALNGLTLTSALMNPEKTPHGKAGAELLRRAGCPESVAVVVGAHHGRPEDTSEMPLENIRCYGENYWDRSSRRAWKDLQGELIDAALSQAGYPAAEEMPVLPVRAQMLLTGLIIMADWIASNTGFFPLISVEHAPSEYDDVRWRNAMNRVHLPKPWAVGNSWTESDFFSERFGFEANYVQHVVLETAAAVSEPGIMILEAPMGVGKTEAALSVAEVFMNRFHLGGVAFFLPSQATSNAMFSRLKRWAETQPDAMLLTVQLAHAMAAMNDEFAALEQGTVRVQEDAPSEHALTVNSFFRGRKTTLLADLVIGTVDQMLMAGLLQKHVMLRHLGLAGKVVIVDECHAYDAYMNRYLDRVLGWLGAYHVPVILLSATLPSQRREALLAAYLNKRRLNDPQIGQSEAYPLLTWTDQTQAHMRAISDDTARRTVRVQRIEENALLEELRSVLMAGGCVGVILNTVRRVQELAERIHQQLPQARVLIDHSQFLALDRQGVEQAILDCVGKYSTPAECAGVIVLGSQVLEQSLDIDFDLLVTDLCPMDLLLQRIGRLHRRSRARPESLKQARCLILHGDPRALEEGARAVYGDYLLLRTGELLPEIIHLPSDISPLVQKTYDEARWMPMTDAAYEQARAAYALRCEKQRKRAGAYCLPNPGRDNLGETLPELMSSMPGFTDPQARAAVRDGDASVEVLMLGMDGRGQAVLLSGKCKGQRIPMDCEPDSATAREIAKQRIRLPGRFAKSWCVEQTIHCLEEETTRMLPEWGHAPLLQGELFLLLDAQGEALLCNVRLRYDEQMGLIWKEDEHGTT